MQYRMMLVAVAMTGCAAAAPEQVLVNAIQLSVAEVSNGPWCPPPAHHSTEQVCISGLRNGFEASLRQVLDQEASSFHVPARELAAEFRVLDVLFAPEPLDGLPTVEMTYAFQLRHRTLGVLVSRTETLTESYRGKRQREAFMRLVRSVLARVGGAITQAAAEG